MSSLSISRPVLEWAADRLGTTVDGLAKDLAAPSRAQRFLKGELTTTQAVALAKKTGIPFGFLFLSEPPELQRREIPDLRQTPNAEPLGTAFFELLDDIDAKVAWFRQRLKVDEISGPEFVGRFSEKVVTPIAVAQDIDRTLKLHEIDREKVTDHGALFGLISRRLEDLGVLVFRSGVAKGNPHKPLPVTEFRGFAIADAEVPVVFVNGRDSPAAWIFTLLHEAAHIWLGVSGVSDSSASTIQKPKGTEAFCNQVAAEVLTPEKEFKRYWVNLDAAEAIPALARHFKVSRLVVARRALDFGFISQARYDEVASASVPTKKQSGGNPYATIPIRSSRRFTSAVLNSAVAGETLLKEAARLLNSSPDTVMELYRRRASGGPEEDFADA
ncbi:ImmA/IrrE family metallo-endopeptidase [Ramlibacter sp. XY19]|uniref:ImmA/IrrE family metallo-endopeptidase n=1 Tax=Ramlibacter paludis TaxID=2908000 RepID=UPI0023DB1D2D|nr:ImmA/IrrE family metallo-endopeptidase [Ramlibacter paludis]MCG2592138.1 ImmA/IrrE family metallo-endopeptidase [Ramlibacter paludis]